MPDFDPFKRIQPTRSPIGGPGGSNIPALAPDFSDTSVVEAFKGLLGAGVPALGQLQEENREEQVQKAAQILKENEGRLNELYNTYRAAEKAGTVPEGYSPFCFAQCAPVLVVGWLKMFVFISTRTLTSGFGRIRSTRLTWMMSTILR